MRGRKMLIADAVAALLVIAIVVFISVGPINDNPPPSLDQFAKKADKVCFNVERNQAKISAEVFKGVPFNRPAPAAKLTEYAQRILPGMEAQLKAVESATPPRGLQGRLRAYYAKARRVISVLRQVAASPRNAGLLARRGDLLARADDAARNLSLLECGHFED